MISESDDEENTGHMELNKLTDHGTFVADPDTSVTDQILLTCDQPSNPINTGEPGWFP